MDAFDTVFAGKAVKASIRRKLEDGTTRSARLAEGAVPAGLSLGEFAEAALKGTTLNKRGVDRGASLSMSVAVSGAAARSAVLAMGDPAPADAVPPAVARRGRSAAPSANGTGHAEPAAS